MVPWKGAVPDKIQPVKLDSTVALHTIGAGTASPPPLTHIRPLDFSPYDNPNMAMTDSVG